VPVPVDDTDVDVARDGCVVAHRVRSAAHADVVALEQAVTEDRARAVQPLVLVHVEAEQLARIVGIGHVAHARATLGVPQPVRADACAHVELRTARLTTLRDDLYHAVRRFRAVQRRSRRTLDDLDALDVRRIHVVQTAHVRAAALTRAPAGIAVHAHAVDVDDRLVPQGQAAVAADPDRRPGAHLPGPRSE